VAILKPKNVGFGLRGPALVWAWDICKSLIKKKSPSKCFGLQMHCEWESIRSTVELALITRMVWYIKL